MVCQNCGQVNPAGAVQCVSCGALFPVASPPPPARPHVDNNLVWAILATLCCCVPGGIVAIVYAARVDAKVAGGDIEGAMSDAANSRLWSWISFGVGIVVIVLYIAVEASSTATHGAVF